MELVVTEEHIQAARLAGACSESLSRISPGIPVSELEQSSLIWIEETLPELVPSRSARNGLPLWALGSGSGYGDGSGNGYGYWYGDGYGDGSGSGYGDGSGNGYEYGYGDGYGYGYGDGDGDGGTE